MSVEPANTMVECESEGYLLDQLEWWDVCRRVKPHLTWEDFEELWEEFQELKRKKTLQ